MAIVSLSSMYLSNSPFESLLSQRSSPHGNGEDDGEFMGLYKRQQRLLSSLPLHYRWQQHKPLCISWYEPSHTACITCLPPQSLISPPFCIWDGSMGINKGYPHLWGEWYHLAQSGVVDHRSLGKGSKETWSQLCWFMPSQSLLQRWVLESLLAADKQKSDWEEGKALFSLAATHPYAAMLLMGHKDDLPRGMEPRRPSEWSVLPFSSNATRRRVHVGTPLISAAILGWVSKSYRSKLQFGKWQL